MNNNWVSSAAVFMQQKGFRTEEMKKIEGVPCIAGLYGFREGRSLWKFFPFEDHFFFYDFNDPWINTAENLLNVHNAARQWVDKRFSLPKWMRYKVPNIVTVAFSAEGFSAGMKEIVSRHAPYGVGGEKHSMYLIDTSERKLYSAGIERTSSSAVVGGASASVTIAPANVNPVNRAYHLIREFMDQSL